MIPARASVFAEWWHDRPCPGCDRLDGRHPPGCPVAVYETARCYTRATCEVAAEEAAALYGTHSDVAAHWRAAAAHGPPVTAGPTGIDWCPLDHEFVEAPWRDQDGSEDRTGQGGFPDGWPGGGDGRGVPGDGREVV